MANKYGVRVRRTGSSGSPAEPSAVTHDEVAGPPAPSVPESFGDGPGRDVDLLADAAGQGEVLPEESSDNSFTRPVLVPLPDPVDPAVMAFRKQVLKLCLVDPVSLGSAPGFISAWIGIEQGDVDKAVDSYIRTLRLAILCPD